MSHRIRVRPEVAAQILSLSSYYDGIRENLGEELEDAVEMLLRFIAQFPLLYPKDFGPIRRGVVKQFKLAVFYIVRDEEIDIIEIRDARLEPPDWAARGFTDN